MGKGQDRPESGQTAATDYVPYIFDYVVEAHGDRYYGDDKALVGAVHSTGQPVTVLADVKGKDFAECARRNYGMPMPEGYRKALRLMKQAEEIQQTHYQLCKHAGSFLRCGGGGERPGRGHCPESAGDVSLKSTGIVHPYRRRREWRSTGYGGR